MAKSKTVPGRCAHCGALFEVPAEAIGLAAQCPHCRQQTEVLLALPALDAAASRKMLTWTIIGILILIGALAAAIFAVHLAEKLKDEKRTSHQSARQIVLAQVEAPFGPGS